jgi:hypothetical protein
MSLKCLHCESENITILDKSGIWKCNDCDRKYDDRRLEDIPRDYENYPAVPINTWVIEDGFPVGTIIDFG